MKINCEATNKNGVNNLLLIDSKELVDKYHCPACRSKNRRLRCALPTILRSNSFEIVYTRPLSVVECENCLLHYKDPVPEKIVDLKIYQNYARQKKLRWAQMYPKDLLRDFEFKDTDKVLEVGPGETPVSAVVKNGDHYSLDIDESHLDLNCSVAEDNKVRVILGSIDQPINDGYFEYFDYILLFDVIEHVEDVELVFKNLNSLLKPGGKVLIETGDAFSRSARRYKKHWKYYSIPEHRVFFTKKTFVFLAKKNNFKIEFIKSVRHKGVRTYVGFLKKILAWIKWSLIMRKADIKLSSGELYLTPDLPWDRDHLFVKLKKEM